MEWSPTEHDAAEDAAVIANSSLANDVSALMTQAAAVPTTRLQGSGVGDVTCEALHLALSAIHIDMAWHAGVISADASMEALDREIATTTDRYSRWTRASAPKSRSTP
jgi:hypothetical protein